MKWKLENYNSFEFGVKLSNLVTNSILQGGTKYVLSNFSTYRVVNRSSGKYMRNYLLSSLGYVVI